MLCATYPNHVSTCHMVFPTAGHEWPLPIIPNIRYYVDLCLNNSSDSKTHTVRPCPAHSGSRAHKRLAVSENLTRDGPQLGKDVHANTRGAGFASGILTTETSTPAGSGFWLWDLGLLPWIDAAPTPSIRSKQNLQGLRLPVAELPVCGGAQEVAGGDSGIPLYVTVMLD